MHPLAVVSLVVTVVLPGRRSPRPPRPASFAARVLALALAVGLALNLARTGMGGWYAIFDLRGAGSFAAANEYLPALPALSHGTRFYLDRFAELVHRCPSTSPVIRRRRCSVLRALGLTTATRAAALCIAADGWAHRSPTGSVVPWAASATHGRWWVLLVACSPATLLFGVTSFDSVFATRRAGGRRAACSRGARAAGGGRGRARRRQPPSHNAILARRGRTSCTATVPRQVR